MNKKILMDIKRTQDINSTAVIELARSINRPSTEIEYAAPE